MSKETEHIITILTEGTDELIAEVTLSQELFEVIVRLGFMKLIEDNLPVGSPE